MRYSDTNSFDVSDVELALPGSLKDILDVAVEVLGEYAGDDVDAADYGRCGNTRIERMAWWLVYNLGAFDMGPGAPLPAIGRDYNNASIRLVSLNERHVRSYLPDQARMLAAMLLREAEYAESGE